MRTARPWVAGCVVLGLVASVGAQSRSAPTRVQIADGIYLFRSAPYGDVGLDGNSVAIISSDGVLVFDTIAFNRPGLKSQLPNYLNALEQKIAAADSSSPPQPDLIRMKQTLADDRFFLEQKTGAQLVLPTLTYSSQLTLHMGDREIQVLHYDRAVTPGDTFLYLPKEKVIITGDLLVNPVSYALSCYPTGWLKTLEHIDAMDAAVLVPGHGEPLRDKKLLRATMDVFRALLKEGATAKARGLDPDQAKDEIFPTLHDLMVQITGDAPPVNNAFKTQLVDWYLHRVYDALNGPLTNAISAMPPR